MTLKSEKKLPSTQNTKLQFLSAAEEIFCEQGYKGTTIRAIATKAGANLGALQYYWGSKQELFRDLFKRRFHPLHQESLHDLKAIDKNTPEGEIPNVELILRCLIKLTLAPEDSTAENAIERPSHKLYGRAMTDPSPVVLKEMNSIFNEATQLFIDLMKRACPNLQTAELDWRLNCIIGAHLFSLIHQDRMQNFFGTDTNVDPKLAGEWVIQFLMHGINAQPQKNKT